MTETQTRSRSHFPLLVSRTAGLYLLAMLAYLAARFIFQDSYWVLSLVNSFAIFLFLPLPFLLILALFTRSRAALLSLLPIMVLLILWFGPRFLPKTSAALSPTLRVMTNNIWHVNPTPEEVVQLAEAAQPDVIFLQEVQPVRQRSALTALKSDYPYEVSQTDQIRLAEQGYVAVNRTLSRYPFVEVTPKSPTSLPYDRNVIEVNGQRIALYNVHLVSPVGGHRLSGLTDNYFVQMTLGFDDTERNQEIDTLLAQLAAEPYPYIVAGDFNTSDTSMTYARIAGTMHDSFSEAGSGFGASWPMTRALGWPRLIPPLVRMDYIWHSGSLQAVKVWQGVFDGSDHLPLFADLSLDTP